MTPTKPKIIELDIGELADLLERAEGKLDEQDYAMLKALADSYGGAELGAGRSHLLHAQALGEADSVSP
jgi:hypothetical protein